MKIYSFFIIGILFPTLAFSGIINVPADQPTIQAGINAAVDGDIVLVADGTYSGDGNRDIDFNGKAISVMSENGAENCVIDCEGTETDFHGGFVFNNDEDENSIVLGFTIRNGYTISWHGAISCFRSSPTISNCIITDNTAYRGAGFCFTNSHISINQCVISHNYSEGSGGGIYVGLDSFPTITECFVRENSAGSHGGGIYASGSSSELTINDSIISENEANVGGGIYIKDASIFLSNCEISENSAIGRDGGGLYCWGSVVGADDCIFSRNRANHSGGCVHFDGGTSQNLVRCSILNNFANFRGGGVSASSTYTNIYDCSITDNTAGSKGGGVSMFYSAANLNNSVISNNQAETGGGIQLTSASALNISNCIISGNNASSGGGFHMSHSSTPSLYNCTITANIAESGGGVYCDESTPTFLNCILWADHSQEIFISDSNPTVTFSCIQGGFPGMGNIDLNPIYVQGDLGAYYLSHTETGHQFESPCVNSGSDLAGLICFETSEGEMCLDEFWTRTDGVADSYYIDMGAHYPLPTIPQECTHNGDVTLNEIITSEDAQLCFRIALGLYIPGVEEECAADCDGNIEITSADVQLIFYTALGFGSCSDPLNF
ncbi:hypothetical protein K8T06_11650 [bacterium]|nr:hypothetical protein [bacterium]